MRAQRPSGTSGGWGRGGPPPRPHHGSPQWRPNHGRGRNTLAAGSTPPGPPPSSALLPMDATAFFHASPDQRALSLGLRHPDAGPRDHFPLLARCWDQDQRPYHTVLVLVTLCSDWATGQSGGWAPKVLKHFERWRQGRGDQLKSPDGPFQTEVIRQFGRTRNVTLMSQIFELVGPWHLDRAVLVGHVRTWVGQGDYKRACLCARIWRVSDEFALDQFVIPCLLDNQMALVESLMADSPELQVSVVKFLDHLIPQNTQAISQLIQDYPTIRSKCDRLSGKPLSKLIQKLLDQFALDPGLASHHTASRKHGAFRYHISTKDSETTKLDNWRDLTDGFIKDDLNFGYILIDHLMNERMVYPDMEEALFWVRKYQLVKDKLPYYVQMEMNQTSEPGRVKESVPEPDDDWDDQPSFSTSNDTITAYPLKIAGDSILMISTHAAFRDFLSKIGDEVISGFDSETCPTMGVSKEGIALLQIAFPDRIYLLDVNALVKVLSTEDWADLARGYFCNPDILKLGFGLSSDIKLLAKLDAGFYNLESNFKGILDLEVINRKLFLASTSRISTPYSTEGRGLSGMVEAVLGSPLDKRDQISNWDRRPLSESQVSYAALDAFVLIEIYQRVQKLAEESEQMDFFEKICKELIGSRNKLEKLKKKLSPDELKQLKADMEAVNLTPPPSKPLNEEPVPVTAIKIVCDAMLQGLCKKLRLRGIDSVTIENFEPTERVGEIAQAEARMILTRGNRSFVKLRKFVPSGHCYSLADDNIDHQIEAVMSYFNIKLEDGDFFSRCVHCNGASYMTIPSAKFKELKETSQSQGTGGGSHYSVAHGPDDDYGANSYAFDYCDDDDEDDEYGPPVAQSATSNLWFQTKNGLINMQTAQTINGVTLRVQDVHDQVIHQQDEFYACAKCGKIFWQGSHWDKVLGKNVSSVNCN